MKNHRTLALAGVGAPVTAGITSEHPGVDELPPVSHFQDRDCICVAHYKANDGNVQITIVRFVAVK